MAAADTAGSSASDADGGRRFRQSPWAGTAPRATATSAPWLAALTLAGVVAATSFTGTSAIEVAALWVEPEPGRDLFHGVGGPQLAPDPLGVFRVTAVKRRGFSQGYTVRDAAEREWSAKLYPEARTEVVASRILWGVGYHQPPIYVLERWSSAGARGPNPQGVARFREEKPAFHGLAEAGAWSYADNPFVGTRELAGLLVLQVMLGNSDLKPDNNMRYTLTEPAGGAREWYVARDLGHTFGRTGVVGAPRDDADVFDETPFITAVVDGRVRFDYRGRHRELFKAISVADVQWICRRLSALTDAQWADAFRAGGYADPTAQRYIRRLKQKIAEGLAAGS